MIQTCMALRGTARVRYGENHGATVTVLRPPARQLSRQNAAVTPFRSRPPAFLTRYAAAPPPAPPWQQQQREHSQTTVGCGHQMVTISQRGRGGRRAGRCFGTLLSFFVILFKTTLKDRPWEHFSTGLNRLPLPNRRR